MKAVIRGLEATSPRNYLTEIDGLGAKVDLNAPQALAVRELG